MAQEIEAVYPNSEDASHDIVLRALGKEYAFRFPNGINDLRPVQAARQPPAFPLAQNSWHTGRGEEVHLPNQTAYYDSENMWTTTPNKLHPQLLTQYATGMRDAEMNWPDSGDTMIWKPLYSDTGAENYRYLDIAFTANSSSNRERCFLIVRRRAPAGATSTPGTLTLEWCVDSSDDPGAVQKTVTKTYSDASDTKAYVLEFKPSSVLAVTATTKYHIKIYGSATDGRNDTWEVLCDSAAAGLGSTDNAAWVATTFSPYYRITDEDINQLLWPFFFRGSWYIVNTRASGAASQLWIQGVRGRATAGTTARLTDTGAGQYAGTFPTMTGWYIHFIKGTGAGQTRVISANAATTIDPTVAFDIAPDATTEYVCYLPTADWKEITGHGFGVITGKPQYANGTMFFPQGDSDNIAIMQIDYTDADDHGFDEENTNLNRATLLNISIDPADGPVMWRANNKDTASGAPNGKAVSAARGSTSPAGVPVPFGTDITYNASILAGDNTFGITGLWSYENAIYVSKEDTMYTIVNDRPTEIKYGADASPSPYNGIAAVTGMDGQFYIGAAHDVMFISGRQSIPTGLPHNLPSDRSGHVSYLFSILGWLFASVDAKDGTSSVMKFSFDTQTWSEQMRAPTAGRRMRSIAFTSGVDVRPTMLVECAGELLYQQFPINGVRPVNDSGVLYSWEGILETSTIDLLNSNPKYFSVIEAVIKGLKAAGYGREVMMEYQLDDDIGGTSWVHGGHMLRSPASSISISEGSRHKIRIRFRIENNKVSDPPIIEKTVLTLFERQSFIREWQAMIELYDEDDASGSERYDWLVELSNKAEEVRIDSVFAQLHGKHVAISVEPTVYFDNISEEGVESIAQIIFSEIKQE